MKNISEARANFAVPRSRSSDLFQQQMHPSRRVLFPQSSRRRMQWLGTTRKVGEQFGGLGAGQPFVIGKFGATGHLELIAKGQPVALSAQSAPAFAKWSVSAGRKG